MKINSEDFKDVIVNLIWALFLALLVYCCTSCAVPYKEPDNSLIIVNGLRGDEFYTIKIDSCEYIVFSGTYKGNITHKQNCHNHK